MSRHTSSQRDRQARAGRPHSRVIGVTSAVGAFLGFGMTPLATAPAAQADGFDWIFELIDPLLGIDPGDAPGLDLDAWLDPSAWGDSALPTLDAQALAGGDPSGV